MASLYISEADELPRQNAWPIMALKEPTYDQAVLTIGSETKSAAFKVKGQLTTSGGDKVEWKGTCLIRVHVDAICSIAFGKAPVATTAMKRLAANQTEYFSVSPGDKLSVISNS